MKKISVLFVILFTIFSISKHLSAETIKLATMNWEPFYGESLPENGFFSALSREVFKQAGYDITIEFVPFKRAMVMAERGKYDGVLGAYYNEERNQKFYFPEPVAYADEVFIQNKGQGLTYNQLIANAQQYRVGVLRGGAQSKELKQKGFMVEETTDYIQNIKKLNANRIDVILIGKQVFYYLIHNRQDLKEYGDKLIVINKPFKSYGLYIPITKKREDGELIVQKMNKSLQKIKEDGSYKKILDRFGQK